MRLPCWLGGHEWQLAALRVVLLAGTPDEHFRNIYQCSRCRAEKLGGWYPPKRMPSPPK